MGIEIGGVHHLRLTCRDVARSREFCTSLLGFEVAVDVPPAGDPSNSILFGGCVLIKGSLLMGLRPVAPEDDRFDEDRVGLDHLSFSVPDHATLEEAVRLFDSKGVAHGPITDLPGFGIRVLPFRDPDNIQVELTAPMLSS
jgi:glyoxylase I family protein